jgi:hypothetical protein
MSQDHEIEGYWSKPSDTHHGMTNFTCDNGCGLINFMIKFSKKS